MEGELSKNQTFKINRNTRRKDLVFAMKPAFLLVKVVRSGREASAKIRVFDHEGFQVKEGSQRDLMVVPATKLLVSAIVEKADEDDRSF
ncbi:MAG: hypothetical protein AAEI92_09640, partial [Arenicellales bacterium]